MQRNFRFALLVAVSTFIAVGLDVVAKAPETISYQGVLSDGAGDPVPDGLYTLEFRIYDAMTGGTLLWSETGVPVSVNDGMFTTVIGYYSPFPQNFGSPVPGSPFGGTDTLWLETVVEGEVQSPRTWLHSVPFALSARDLSGWSKFHDGAGIETNAEYPALTFYGNTGASKMRLIGLSYGGLFLANTSDSTEVVLSAASGGGELSLWKPNEQYFISFDAGETGDDAVDIPHESVNAFEIRNEPGIARDEQASNIGLAISDISQDVAAVSITTPSSGYIVLNAAFNYYVTDSGTAMVWAQIGEFSNGNRGGGIFVRGGTDLHANHQFAAAYGSIPLGRAFYKLAGTHTFYLQGNMELTNSVSVTALSLTTSWIQANFYPTSYGAVETIVESPGGHPAARSFVTEDPLTGEKTERYEIDLSYYELKEKEAELALLKARRERRAAEQRRQLEPEQRHTVQDK